jgi:copper(I)-binding protein
MHTILKPLAILAALGVVGLALPAAAAKPGPVKVTGAWCRAAPTGALAGGCYVTLTAAADDRLVAVETTAADHGEIHTMSMEGGVMRMRRLADGIALPAGKAVSLKPGAEHVMIIGPKVALTPGAKVTLTLRFKSAPPVTVTAPVKIAPAPTLPGMSMERH